MKRFILYGIKNPKDKLENVYPVQFDCKVHAFSAHERSFQVKYWHEVTPAWNVAKKEGWRIVKGYFKEASK